MKKAATTTWAEEEFAGAKLGDVRRTRRLVEIAAGVARTPSGKVSKAFSETRAREGAYDLLENVHVRTEQVAVAMYEAATARAADAGIFAYVAVDGSSLNLTDKKRAKGFGRVGTDECGARGMKVMNALCIDAKGVPIGLVDQKYWARPEPLIPGATRQQKAQHTRKRPFAEKEGIRFLEAATNATERLAKAGVRAWIVIDREGDNRGILSGLSSLSCDFTVRASWDRLIADTTQERMPIRTYIMSQPVIGTYEVEVSRTGQRAARTAEMSVRVGSVELRLRDKIKKEGGTPLDASRMGPRDRRIGISRGARRARLDVIHQCFGRNKQTGSGRRAKLCIPMANRGISSHVEVGRVQRRGYAAPIGPGRHNMGDYSGGKRRPHRAT